MHHLLVTNDFPPKVGGIQSYLWELWRRLPPEEVTVLTTPYDGTAAFDAEQAFEVVRTRQRVLWPTPALRRQVDGLAASTGADLVVLDPALPVGLLGPELSVPYAVVVHGAEVTVPGRLPVTRPLLARVLRGAVHVIAAGGYPAAEAARAAGRALPTTVVPPGVDGDRFRPLTDDERVATRLRLGIDPAATLVVSVSRLVPRKGMDVLVRAAARLGATRPDLCVAVAGGGRDRRRLERLVASTGAPVRLLGRVDDELLPAAYGAADVFAMLCRSRWAGLEQEGFGIVFLEAAACGVPQVAGDSGGSAEAVIDGGTGVVVRRPADLDEVTAALASLLDDGERRARLGRAARERAVAEFSYDGLAARLRAALATAAAGGPGPPAPAGPGRGRERAGVEYAAAEPGVHQPSPGGHRGPDGGSGGDRPDGGGDGGARNERPPGGHEPRHTRAPTEPGPEGRPEPADEGRRRERGGD